MSPTTSRTRRIIREDEDRRDRRDRLATPGAIDVYCGTASNVGNIASMNFGHSDVNHGSIHIIFENNGSVSIKHLLCEYPTGATLSTSTYNTSEGLKTRGQRNGEFQGTESMLNAFPNSEDLESAFREVSALPVKTEQIAIARRAVTEIKNGTFEVIPQIVNDAVTL
jgi:hypothetical protein